MIGQFLKVKMAEMPCNMGNPVPADLRVATSHFGSIAEPHKHGTPLSLTSVVASPWGVAASIVGPAEVAGNLCIRPQLAVGVGHRDLIRFIDSIWWSTRVPKVRVLVRKHPLRRTDGSAYIGSPRVWSVVVAVSESGGH